MISVDHLERLMKPKDDKIAALEANLDAAQAEIERLRTVLNTIQTGGWVNSYEARRIAKAALRRMAGGDGE